MQDSRSLNAGAWQIETWAFLVMAITLSVPAAALTLLGEVRIDGGEKTGCRAAAGLALALSVCNWYAAGQRAVLKRPIALASITFAMSVVVLQVLRLSAGARMSIGSVAWDPWPIALQLLLFTAASALSGWVLLSCRSPRTVSRIQVRVFVRRLDRARPYLAGLAGLGVGALISVPLAFGFWLLGDVLVQFGALTSFHRQNLALMGFVGAQASGVSILIRMRALKGYGAAQRHASLHEAQVDADGGVGRIPSSKVFLTAAAKPFVGMTFAHLAYCMAQANMVPGVDPVVEFILPVPLTHQPPAGVGDNAIFPFLVLAFLAGYTERFAPDIFSDLKPSN